MTLLSQLNLVQYRKISPGLIPTGLIEISLIQIIIIFVTDCSIRVVYCMVTALLEYFYAGKPIALYSVAKSLA